jgi:predicted nucleic acid-binding protein
MDSRRSGCRVIAVVLVIDSSIWVSALISSEIHHADAIKVMESIANRRHQVVLPTAALTEIVSATSRRGSQVGLPPSAALRFGDKLARNPDIAWKNIDKSFAFEASACAVSHGLRGMDAIFAATATFTEYPYSLKTKNFKGRLTF